TFLLRALKGRGNVRDIFARNRRAGQSDFPSVPPPLPTSKKSAPVTLPLASALSVGAFSTSLLASRRQNFAARPSPPQRRSIGFRKRSFLLRAFKGRGHVRDIFARNPAPRHAPKTKSPLRRNRNGPILPLENRKINPRTHLAQRKPNCSNP